MTPLWIMFSVLALALVPVTVLTYRRFALPSIPTMYGVCVMVSWYFGFLGIILLPLDLALTLESGPNKSPPGELLPLWLFVYWVTFVFAWLLDPILQAYHDAGQYTWQERLRAAVRANVRFYVIAIISIVAFAVWRALSTGTKLSEVVEFLIGISNAYGLVFIILMLGYSLVAVPRQLYAYAHPEQQLRSIEFHAWECLSNFENAEYELRALAGAIDAVRERTSSAALASDKDLQDFANLVIAAVPLEMPPLESTSPFVAELVPAQVGVSDLTRLHAKLKRAIARYDAADGEWAYMVRQAEILQHVIGGMGPPHELARGWRWRLWWSLRITWSVRLERLPLQFPQASLY